MTETPQDSEAFYKQRIFHEFNDEDIIFYRELFKQSTAYRSLPEFVRGWAVDSGYKEETGDDLNDSPFLAMIYARSSAIISYANSVVNADTDNYNDPVDQKFHKDLIEIAADIETNWELRENTDWKNKITEDIKHRIFKYTKSKKN
ncbi:MAG TPA: hypothetical protein VLE44_00500 [Candidatus Saccharimonadales bacterium]|nr:hypothetical protein [Candidatus Saccharimonadales bacterium]